MTTKRPRGSILVAASDALGFKFGRRKTPIIRQPPPMPLILPGVIEISASRRDEEVEERDRLREVAVQALGLQVIPTPEAHSLVESVEEEVEEEEEAVEYDKPALSPSAEVDAFNFAPLSPKDSVHSIVPPSPVPFNRLRSQSLLVHSRANSISISPPPPPLPIPPFPATFTAIDQFQQSGTMLYKYYQSSSLRIFALSKNWRHRFMVLSSPTTTRNSGPSVSYLHLFKSSAGEDKEMERLEINEDSVVFIAEEEVGGRKHVVKVGGVDVGAMKKDLNTEEAGRTMWFLNITDPTEAQKWITVIKTAILGQRTVRAGLGLPTLGGIEPRGDMDVMLSMRAQGLITPPTTSKPTLPQNGPPPTQNGTATPDRTYASSIASHHSQATIARSGSTSAVSALKGLFSGSTRPRSGSRATSIDLHDIDQDPLEDSFGSMGNHLLGRPTTVDNTMRPHSVTTHASLPISGSVISLEHRLDRKILNDGVAHWGSTSTPTADPHAPTKTNRANKTLSLGALSLQPPPRKRWTSAGLVRPGPESLVYGSEGNATRTDVAVTGEAEPSPSTAAPSFTFGTPEQRPKASSIKSVSTLASTDNTASAERTSTSTKRSSRRWSRQLGILPQRLSPPSGPPPSIPTNPGSTSRVGRLSVEIPTTQSETGSTHSGSSHKSFVSSLPSFSKRASASSSVSASSPVQSPVSRPSSTQGHRISMPPQRPPPTSALPPAPDQNMLNSDTPSSSIKPSFRDSVVANRANRLSLIAPKPPPSSVLPPRPDGTSPPKSQRRNSSTGNYSHQSTLLEAIPASPVPPPHSPPFPPPMGPLPPTPTASQSSTTSQPSRPLSQHISLKKRLRILSAPSSTAATSTQLHSSSFTDPHSTDNVLSGFAPLRRPLPTAASISISPPATPIAEKITLYQNDPSFLQINTPVIPHLPPPRALPVPPEPAEIMSLSPPPRRGSKQISVIDSDVDPPAEEDKPQLDGERRLMSLSRPGSVVSLGIVSV
ncbi:hypothetical protein C0991_007986 [Blastosporella zonata]|nr:hypothetical protein C0991_007986 [Blastosporella zonata]